MHSMGKGDRVGANVTDFSKDFDLRASWARSALYENWSLGCGLEGSRMRNGVPLGRKQRIKVGE